MPGRSAGFIRQQPRRAVKLPDKSGVPVAVSRSAPYCIPAGTAVDRVVPQLDVPETPAPSRSLDPDQPLRHDKVLPDAQVVHPGADFERLPRAGALAFAGVVVPKPKGGRP
jgi:hypothetical protein